MKNALLRFFALLGSVGLYLLAFLLGLFLVFFWFDRNMLSPLEVGSEKEVLFEIKEGWNLQTIAEELEKGGLIRKWWSIYYLSKLRSEDEKLSIVAGEYSLSPSQSPNQILDELLDGETVQHELTIPSGATVRQVAGLIAEADLVPESEAFDALRDQHTMARLGIPAYIPEGYLTEGVYRFRKPITGAQIITKIVTESKDKLDKQLENWKARATELNFRPYEILTLASLLEKETSSSTERKKISSVYHNRLRIGMQLQSDPALRYGLPPDQEEITQADINDPGPYNLYLNTGLPPTPICTPSFAALDAALYPDDTDFLYFVDRGDGSFDYSTTFKEHQQKLDKYKAGGAAALIQRSQES